MKKIFLGVLLMAVLISSACSGIVLGEMDDSGMPPPPQNGGKQMTPPQEAIDACVGKAEGAACEMGRGGTGVCASTPDKKYFACRPNMPFGGKRGPGGRPGSNGNESSDF